MTDSIGPNSLDPLALSECVVNSLDDMKAIDIQTLDVRGKTSVADFMVVATGSSRRHVKALAERVQERVEAQGQRAMGVEGVDAAEWVLVDLGDVIVHVMQAETRSLYALEKLWSIDLDSVASQSASPES